ncbi:MAG TPA: parvulin peptidyl-prolyl isomerase [Candidatus Cloacimonas sp.]|nr:parvulin peptidyl-prolyl isomerase [Candidatus Cloacimonas sp.]
MHIIAKIVKHDITDKDIARELACGGTSEQALKRLIDRCLMLAKADQLGMVVTDEEFDIALMELLDEEEPFGLPAGSLQNMEALEMETLLRNSILIRKYLSTLYPIEQPIEEEKLKELYDEQIQNFCSEEMVRCSHILIKGEDALKRITEIRSHVNNRDDFFRACSYSSECPSNRCCGDLGFFPRGKLFPEIDSVAFNMEIDEISEPFASPEGYHILILTDRKCKAPIPFEEIKSSLAAQILQMEREYILMKHLDELYEEFKSQIKLFEDAVQ